MKPLPAWSVQVEAHRVARWDIPEQVVEVRATSRADARVAGVREVHIRLGIAPWKPWMRLSYLRTTATPVESTSKARKGRSKS